MENESVERKQILIGLSAKIACGKDVFADIAVEEFGFIKLPFAKALKDEVAEFLNDFNIPFNARNLWGSQSDKEEVIRFPQLFDFSALVDAYPFLERKCRDLTFRQLLQLWGTEYRRSEDHNYWVKKTLDLAGNYDKVVISDVRFENEADAIIEAGGEVIRINRSTNFNSDHPSEISLDNYNRFYLTINNEDTLNWYQNACRFILTDIELERNFRKDIRGKYIGLLEKK